MSAFFLPGNKKPALGRLLLAVFLMAGVWTTALADLPLMMEEPKRALPAQDFHTITPDKTPVKLSDYKGQVVFLNFWATWCPPCLKEMPAMERLFLQMKGKPFVMLAVNQGESLEVVRAFLKRRGFTFPVVMDESGDIGASYNANALPLTYIIDRKGLIVGRARGSREWDQQEMVNWLLALGGQGGAATAANSRPEGVSLPGAVQTPATAPGLLPEVLRQCESPLVAASLR